MTKLQVLDAALRQGWVAFMYIKDDQKLRYAIGTRNHALAQMCLGRDFNENERYYTEQNGYFDFCRMGWRRFNADRFVDIVYEEMDTDTALPYAFTMFYVDTAYKNDGMYERVFPLFTSIFGKCRIQDIEDNVFDFMEEKGNARYTFKFSSFDDITELVKCRISPSTAIRYKRPERVIVEPQLKTIVEPQPQRTEPEIEIDKKNSPYYKMAYDAYLVFLKSLEYHQSVKDTEGNTERFQNAAKAAFKAAEVFLREGKKQGF